MPVRKVSNRGRKNVIGSFPSLKKNRMVAFESLGECNYISLLDFDPDVLDFEEQPLSIEYQYEGKPHSYTPDFLVKRTNQVVIVECKPAIFVDTPENQRKFNAARLWCEERGYQFQVVVEIELRSGFRLENIKFLRRFARQDIEPEMRALIYDLLFSARGGISINNLATHVSPTNLQIAIPKLLHMAFHHEIEIPLDEAKISGDTIVSLPRP